MASASSPTSSPYLCDDGPLFAEAEAGGHFGRTASGETYLVDFGEFFCGILDFTREETRDWFAERIIGREMLDIGVRGFMCDFGEYLPVDVVLSEGDAKLLHNTWPVLRGGVAKQAVASRGLTGEAVWFMRAGYTGIQSVCPLLRAGDQSVDFSRHDGLVTTIVAALSSGLLGNADSHCGIGGYTSLFGNVRTAELLMRWAEMAAFTPVMRTDEGNRPADNLQVDGDAAVLAQFRPCGAGPRRAPPLSRDPLRRRVCPRLAAAAPAIPAPRERRGRLGGVGPVPPRSRPPRRPGVAGRPREVDADAPRRPRSVHRWTGARHEGGTRPDVAAPFGAPPVFFSADTRHEALFRALAAF